MNTNQKKLKSSIIYLEKLYPFAKKDKAGEAIKNDSSIGKKLGKEIKELTISIPESPGFYIWGKYEKNGQWKSIYLGKAGTGKTASLRDRINKELNVERIFLWIKNTEDENKYFQVAQNHYKNSWSKKSENHYNRSIEKKGSQFIIWCESKTLKNEKEIKEVEKFLIEMLNPKVNVQRSASLEGNLDAALRIFKEFIRIIIENRPTKNK
jgi:hypothetical protein